MLFVARIEIKRWRDDHQHFLVSIRRKNIGYSTSEMPNSFETHPNPIYAKDNSTMWSENFCRRYHGFWKNDDRARNLETLTTSAHRIRCAPLGQKLDRSSGSKISGPSDGGNSRGALGDRWKLQQGSKLNLEPSRDCRISGLPILESILAVLAAHHSKIHSKRRVMEWKP